MSWQHYWVLDFAMSWAELLLIVLIDKLFEGTGLGEDMRGKGEGSRGDIGGASVQYGSEALVTTRS